MENLNEIFQDISDYKKEADKTWLECLSVFLPSLRPELTKKGLPLVVYIGSSSVDDKYLRGDVSIVMGSLIEEGQVTLIWGDFKTNWASCKCPSKDDEAWELFIDLFKLS